MPLLLLKRMMCGKEINGRYRERLGRYLHSRPTGELIWIHAASVGEFNSIKPIVEKLSKHKFLITTVTASSAKAFENAAMKNALHQFAPFDSPQIVSRFLKHWKPSIGIFIDSEIWPNLLCQASNECKLLLLNARLSDKSAKRWSKASSFAKFIFGKFTQVMPTSDDDSIKLRNFVSQDKVKNIGNLKYAPQNISVEKLASLKVLSANIGARPFWVAATVHNQEIEDIIKVHASMRAIYPEFLTILVPKHLSSVNDVMNIASRNDIKTALRSSNDQLSKDVDMYVINTIGELSALFSISKIAFVGGSLFNHGGHNILEPARYGNAIISGQYTHNFRDIIKEFQKNDAILIVKDAQDLSDALKKLLKDKKLASNLGANAKSITDKYSQVVENAVQEILTFI